MQLTKKAFSFLILFILIGLKSFSQESKLFEKSSIWIKSHKNQKITIFFNENPVVKKIENLEDFKNKLSGKSTLFLAFNCNPKLNTKIMTLDYGKEKINITNKGISKNTILEHSFDESGAKIISYTFNNPTLSLKVKNNLIVDMLTKQNSKENQLLEVIYFPEVLSTINIRKVETYLSIKYGISLDKDKDYISFKTDTIWNSKENKVYSNRVTGITDNYKVDYRQMKSGNSEKDGIYIEYDTLNINKETLHNQTNYFLWGDNNKALIFKTNPSESNFEYFERSWKLQSSEIDYQSGFPFYNFYINKKELKITSDKKTNKKVGLVFSETEEGLKDINQSKLVALNTEDSVFVAFKNITLSKELYFTLVKLPEIFIQYKAVANCDAKVYDYNFTINGGIPSYKIEILNAKNTIIEKLNLTGSEFSTTFKMAGKYTIVVYDKMGNKITQEILIDKIYNSDVLLPTEILLEENSKETIVPVLVDLDNSSTKFEWFYNNELFAVSKDINVEKTGDYTLKVTNKDCSNEQNVKVVAKNSNLNSEIVLKPNPIKVGENFSLSFDFVESQNIEIYITDSNGKVVSQEILKGIKQSEYISTLTSAGVYFITILNKEKKQVFKLIVL